MSVTTVKTMKTKTRPLLYSEGTSLQCGPGNSVGRAIELPGWTVRDRIPVGGRDFPPVETGPGSHLASCTMGIGSFQGVEAAGTWG